jgi:hypothetical protein
MSETKNASRLKPTTPAEALDLLKSAIMYVQHAGLTVRATRGKTGLLLVIVGADVVKTDDSVQFVPLLAPLGDDVVTQPDPETPPTEPA